MHSEPRTTVAVLLVTSCNALAYNVVHYKMIAVRCCWSCAPMSFDGLLYSATLSQGTVFDTSRCWLQITSAVTTTVIGEAKIIGLMALSALLLGMASYIAAGP